MSSLRERLSRAYVDGYERGMERGPKHPTLYPVVFAAGWMTLFLIVGISSGDAGIGTLIGVLILAYFIPALVAWGRRVHNSGQVIIVNLFLGWTIIGWVVALVMAASPRRRPGGYIP